MSNPPLLEVDKLRIHFRTRDGEAAILRDVSIRLAAGERLGIAGESGSGKSTLAMGILRTLSQNGSIHDGSIRFMGEDITHAPEKRLQDIRGVKMALIPQDPFSALNPLVKIGRQLREILTVHTQLGRTQAQARVMEILRAVKLPDPERLIQAYPHQLSGGQQQRVLIAMALLLEPDLLILDEPTTALDVTTENAIMALVQELRANTQMSLLLISHNIGLLAQNCDRLCVLYAGEIVEIGAIGDVLHNPRHPYTQALLQTIPNIYSHPQTNPLQIMPGSPPTPLQLPAGCVFGPRCKLFKPGLCDQAPIVLSPVDAGQTHHSRCLRIEEMADSTPKIVQTLKPPEDITTPENALEISALSKSFEIKGSSKTKRLDALKDIHLTAQKAKVLAIVGESGSGKSTLAKILLGLETTHIGHVHLGAEEIQSTPVEARSMHLIHTLQMVFQNPSQALNPTQTIKTQLMRVLEMFDRDSSPAQLHAKMLRLLDRVKLPHEIIYTRPDALSGGQKQRIAIVRAIAAAPEILVADEPLSALDISVQAAIAELLIEIQKEDDMTLVVIAHDLAMVRYLANHIAVMYMGYLFETGTTSEITAAPFHPYTEALFNLMPGTDLMQKKDALALDEDALSQTHKIVGCPFEPRCPRKSLVTDGACQNMLPDLHALSPTHHIRCHLYREHAS